MSLDPVLNFGKVAVSTTYDDTATSIELSSGDGAKLPAPATDGEFNLVWWNVTDYFDPADDPNVEIVRVTARSSDTLTISRAQEGTSASTKNTSGKSYKMILAFTKKMYDDIAGGVTAVEDLSSQCDGANKAFNIAVSGSSTILLVGTDFPRIYKPTTDFTETGAVLTMTASVDAPTNGATLLRVYVK